MLHRDDRAAKLGMWLFLFTELLLFGGLFIVYSVYRYLNPEDFHHGSEHLDLFFGTFNTGVLITSSFTIAASITATQKGKTNTAIWLLIITILLAFVFMINKYFEWGHKFEIGLYPNGHMFNELPNGEKLFFVLYYFMTGLHGLHVLVGAIIIGFAIIRLKQGKQGPDNFAFQENAGLYWHLVDLIWIFLFPLMYLIT